MYLMLFLGVGIVNFTEEDDKMKIPLTEHPGEQNSLKQTLW